MVLMDRGGTVIAASARLFPGVEAVVPPSGDRIGRLWAAGLRVDDPASPRCHADVSLRDSRARCARPRIHGLKADEETAQVCEARLQGAGERCGVSDRGQRMKLPIGTQVERFQVEAFLGQGGAGYVYRVRHESLGLQWALKIIRLDVPELRAQLLDEGRAGSCGRKATGPSGRPTASSTALPASRSSLRMARLGCSTRTASTCTARRHTPTACLTMSASIRGLPGQRHLAPSPETVWMPEDACAP